MSSADSHRNTASQSTHDPHSQDEGYRPQYINEGVHNGNTSSATVIADNGEGPSRHQNATLPTVEEASIVGDSRLTPSHGDEDEVMRGTEPTEPPSHQLSGGITYHDDDVHPTGRVDEALSRVSDRNAHRIHNTLPLSKRIEDLKHVIQTLDEMIYKLSATLEPDDEHIQSYVQQRATQIDELKSLRVKQAIEMGSGVSTPRSSAHTMTPVRLYSTAPSGRRLDPNDKDASSPHEHITHDENIHVYSPLVGGAEEVLPEWGNYPQAMPRRFHEVGKEIVLPDQISPEPPNIKELRDLQGKFKVTPPKEYNGKHLSDLESFLSGWNQVWRTQNWLYNSQRDRVNVAAQRLTGTAKEQWDTAMESHPPLITHINWPNFETFLRSMIGGRVNLQRDAYLELKKLELQKGESISSLVTRLRKIERDLPARDEVVRINDLLTAIPRDSKLMSQYQTLSFNHEPATVAEFITLATTAQESLRQGDPYAKRADYIPPLLRKSSETSSTKDSTSYSKDGSNSQKQNRNRDRRPHPPHPNVRGGSGEGSSKNASIVCYTCGKPGHKSPDCRSKKKESGTLGKRNRSRTPEGRRTSAVSKESQRDLSAHRGSKKKLDSEPQADSGKGKDKS